MRIRAQARLQTLIVVGTVVLAVFFVSFLLLAMAGISFFLENGCTATHFAYLTDEDGKKYHYNLTMDCDFGRFNKSTRYFEIWSNDAPPQVDKDPTELQNELVLFISGLILLIVVSVLGILFAIEAVWIFRSRKRSRTTSETSEHTVPMLADAPATEL